MKMFDIIFKSMGIVGITNELASNLISSEIL